jgi:hypothetical protein
MAAATIDRPCLRLATTAGRAVRGRAHPTRPLTDAEAEDELVAVLAAMYPRLDAAGDFRVEISLILARLEQRQARRSTNGSGDA